MSAPETAPDSLTSAVALPVIGEFTLLSKLASGGMATVYVGRKSGVAGFERLVAIKCCHPHLRDNEEFVSMFLDEARLAAGIRHPNVVGTLDVNDGDPLYIVMEYIEGCSLSTMVRAAGRAKRGLPPGIAVRIMIDTLRGLHAAHMLRGGDGELLNVVHRDVSPQNILVGIDGGSRITDFGIALASVRSTHTQDGIIKGKFAYLAPEQIKGRNVNRQLDIFSAGTVLWEALTGQPLFKRRNDAATINAVMTEPIHAPSSVAGDLPAGLDDFVLHALNRDPAQRYESAAQFADVLEELNLPESSSRHVAAYLEDNFGTELARRQVEIRTAALDSAVRIALTNSTSTVPSSESGSGSQLLEPAIADRSGSKVREITPAAPPFGEGELEHRRTRAIFAAVMLLLVGSAVGLLLARSNTDASTPGPRELNAAPSHTNVSQTGHLPGE